MTAGRDMGCDIHFYVEQLAPDGTWRHAPDVPEPPRSYALFNALAGVRREQDDPPPFFEPQHELPADVSAEVLEHAAFWEGCGHGFSSRTLTELLSRDWTGLPFGETLQAMAALGPPDRVRAIFWFDH